jgi:hypothetical protein
MGSKELVRPSTKDTGLTMRSYQFLRVISLATFLLFGFAVGRADVATLDAAGKSLPEQLGNFKATGPVLVTETHLREVASSGERSYRTAKGGTFSVRVLVTSSDANAYSLLTTETNVENGQGTPVATREIGTLGYTGPRTIYFFKGPVFVTVSAKGEPVDSTAMLDLAQQSAALLDKGEGDLPVLVKHLPDWEKAQAHARYALDTSRLERILPGEAILDALSFAGGAEAVVAPYGSSKLLIVEFSTPQLAGDNDRRIIARIHELWQQGLPAPTAYRRVGNYSVFVFNAPNEQAANQLIDQVKYEQVVQWLGDNPNLLERAQRHYTETLLGTFIAVIKASGLAAVLCFGVGGFFGALLFARRRAQQKTVEAYSDAGGMTRLNLDELTVEPNAARLLRPMSDKT